MSEYQYYEFQSLDQPLSDEAQDAIHALSSRVQLTSSQAIFVYNYGNFRGDPYDVLVEYFDAMLYITNWGSRHLAFRFPKAAIDLPALRPYLFRHSITVEENGDYIVLSIAFEDEGGDNWEYIDDADAEKMLSQMTPMREDLMRGDMRLLYLAWLKFAIYSSESHDYEDYDDDNEEEKVYQDDDENAETVEDKKAVPDAIAELIEPPVPANLDKLSRAHRSFIAFIGLDPDLVTSAAQASRSIEETAAPLNQFVSALSDAEKDDFLLRLLHGEPRLDLTLRSRLRRFSTDKDKDEADPSPEKRRSIVQLSALTAEVKKVREAEIRRQVAEKLRARLKEVEANQDKLWSDVRVSIERRNPRGYDDAVSILTDFHTLAKERRQLPAFQEKVRALLSRYPALRSLHSRVKEARVLED